MTRGMGLLGLALLVCGQARAQAPEVWSCSLIESHHFATGKDVSQKGGGDYRIEIKPPAIDLTANGQYILGYQIAENSENRLMGQGMYETGNGVAKTYKLVLDKLNGRIVQTGLNVKGGSEELVELINGRCKSAR